MMIDPFSPLPVDPRWKFWLARLFGRRSVGIDKCGGVTTIVTTYTWQGVTYVWAIQEKKERGQ